MKEISRCSGVIHAYRETALTKAKVKEAHRRMMIANHPDRGGAPFLASKINEAKVCMGISTYALIYAHCLRLP